MSKLKMQMFDCDFSKLSDDLVLNIFSKLEDDPRHWARLACVSTRFSSLIRTVCCKLKCSQTIPSVVSDLLSATSSSAAPPGGWASMYKLSVCCPGLVLSGVLLGNSDFGLERELGPDEQFTRQNSDFGLERELVPHSGPADNLASSGRVDNMDSSSLGEHSGSTGRVEISSSLGLEGHVGSSGRVDNLDSLGRADNIGSSSRAEKLVSSSNDGNNVCESNVKAPDCCWSLYDDLLFDTMYDESVNGNSPESLIVSPEAVNGNSTVAVKGDGELSVCKKKKISKSLKSHLASGVWNLSREQGNKLLASRFKGDCLYICDWPGCIHMEEKRNYMVFRGIFKNFKQTRVWRTINDGRRKMIELNCAYCGANQTWDLHSAFCLRSHFGFHDDGEPVVRAYVCENGHVSGAWTDWPLYT